MDYKETMAAIYAKDFGDCPECGLKISAQRDVSVAPICVLHAQPSCELFTKLDAVAFLKHVLDMRAREKPRYEHDCEACIFLGHYTHLHDFDLYVCPRETLGVCCIARWSSEGPDYSSMSLEPKMWNESRAAIGGPRQSMYHCYIPELCEAWARWKARQDTVVFHTNPDIAKEA